MEQMYATNGKGNLGVALGAIGTGLGVLGNGIGLMNNGIGRTDSGSHAIDRYEMNTILDYERQLEAKNNEILSLATDSKLKSAEIYTDKKSIEMYSYIDGRLRAIEKNVADNAAAQGIINQSVSDGVSVLNTQVAGINNILGSITQTKVPNSAVCPGWGHVTVTPTPYFGGVGTTIA